MKRFKRLLSSLLLICTLTTSVLYMLPPMEVKAATITSANLNSNGFYIDSKINGFWEALNEQGKKIVLTSEDENLVTFSGSAHTNPMYSSQASDGSLNDWNQNFSEISSCVTSSKTTRAYEDFVYIMDSLAGKDYNEQHEWDYGKTFGFADDNEAINYINDFATNGSDDDAVVNIYKSYGKSNDSADDWSWYTGCDMNTHDGLFYYYYLYIGRSPGDDEYITMMFVSDKLYLPDEDEYKEITDNNNIATNLVVALQDTINNVESEKNIFSYPFDGESYTNYQRIYDLVNYHISCTDTGDANGTVKLNARSYGVIVLPDKNSNDSNANQCAGDSFEKDYENLHSDGVKAELGAADWVNFSNSDAMTGGSKLIATINEDKYSSESFGGILGSLTASILNGASTSINGEITTDQIRAKAKEMCGSNYENKYIYQIFDNWADVLKEAIKNSQIQSEFESLADLDKLVGKTDYEIFSGIVELHLNCMVAGTTMPDRFSIGDVGYTFRTDGNDITGYTGYTSMKELFNSANISDLQRAQLATEYVLKLKSIDKESSGVKFKLLTNYYNNTVLSSYVAPGSDDNIIITSGMIEETETMLGNYSEADLTSNGTATNILKVANIATRYALVSAVLNKNNIGDSTITSVYNADLEQLVSKPFVYAEGQQNYWSMLPKSMTTLTNGDASKWKQLLFTNSEGSTESWNRFISVLYNIEYAASICAFSDQGSNSQITPEQLEAWFNSEDNSVVDSYPSFITEVYNSGVNPDMDAVAAQNAKFSENPVSINMLRSIIEIYDVCKFLGIGENDWSPAIASYIRIYEKNKAFFEALRLNPTIYNSAEVGSATVEEPLGKFFNIGSNKVTDQWTKGFAMSALYVPMETNLYDAESIAFLNDPEWISEFYYKYGFFRKALYVNTDSSAIVNEFVTGDKSSTKVATLKDLLNYDRDIILYVDDNFYNARDIRNVISSLDYTNIRAEANKDLTTEESKPSFSGSMSGAFGELADLDAAQILKTDSHSYYSDSLAKKVTKFSVLNDKPLENSLMDVYLLSQNEILGNKDEGIESALDADEYSVKQSYAVVSAVYRDAELYNTTLRSIATDNAIFKSSSAICSTPGTKPKDWLAVYNYYMLANLEEQMKNDVASTLDLDAPIFCDLFGNIITESGLVIIPAASNATLCREYWTPYNIGWSEYYNNGNRIPDGKYTDEFYSWLIGDKYTSYADSTKPSTNNVTQANKSKGGGYFVLDRLGVFNLRTTSLSSNNLSAVIQWEGLNKNSSIIQQLFYNHNYFECGMKLYSPMIVNMIVEVLRGAPIEYIDYEQEGLQGNLNISKFGIYIAYKLEEITDALIPSTNGSNMGGNSIITMPNLAFVDGIEVYMLYAYKITFAVMIVALAVSLYMDAVQNKLGIKSVITFIVTCMGVLLSFTVLPDLVGWSYYNANKSLLAEESGHIMMLNYVKDLDGAEISVTEIRTPESSTDLYLKVGTFDLRWWDIVGDVLFNDTVETVSDLYENQLKDNTLAGQAGVQMKADGLYVNIQDIYDSTAVNYSPSTGVLTNTSLAYAYDGINYTDTVASYSSPYYVFLDHLLNSINEYNITRKVSSLSWNVGSNGHVLTYDVASPYLTSAEFLEEGYDILGMYNILDYIGKAIPCPGYSFSDNDESKMKLSYWYTEYYSPEVADTKVKELYDFARDYILINKNLLGKVPDEVFVKVFAMQLAIKYNELFEVGVANSVEIMNVDTRDLLRFIVASPEQVYRNYSYSWARFAYEESGGFGVIICAILLFLIWLTSYIKPLLMLVILGLLIINIVGRKLLFRKESRSIEGYLIGCACLCLCNYAYSIMLKVTMNINALGLGSVTALIMGILTQVLYIASLSLIVGIEVKDWKNNGYNEFRNIGANISSNIINVSNLVADKFHSATNEAYKAAGPMRRAMAGMQTRSLDDMFKRDEERIVNSEDNIN